MAETDQQAAAPYRAFCAFCGLTLLFGFFMPIVAKAFGGGGVEMRFVSIEGLDDDSVSGMGKFLLLYPVIGAVAVFILMGVTNAIARNITFITIGLIPAILLFVHEETKDMMRQMSGPMLGLDDFDWRLILGIVAWLGILSAAYGGKQNPSGRFALVAGVVGACAFLLTQLIPVDIGIEKIMPASVPFKMIGESDLGGEQITIGVLLLAKLALGAAAAILAFCQFAPGPGRQTRYRMMGTFWIIAALIIFLMPITVIVMNMGEDGGWQLLAGATATLKMIAIFLPFYLMIPYGVGGLGNSGADSAPEKSEKRSSKTRAPQPEYYPPAAPPPAAPPAPPRSVEDRLAELQRLFEGGLISEDELSAKRAKILDEI